MTIDKLILASSSPQRKKLLRSAGYRFAVVASHVREPNPARINYKHARKLVTSLAQKKALFVAKQYKNKNYYVLGADTLVVAQKKILGKPRDVAEAEKMLRCISGSWQSVLTGVSLVRARDRKTKTTCAVTRLRLKKMDEVTLKKLARQNLDKSGSYAVQDIKDQFLETIKGDLDNVIGLPIKTVKKLLEDLGYGL